MSDTKRLTRRKTYMWCWLKLAVARQSSVWRQKQLFPPEMAVLCCRFRVRDLNMFASCYNDSSFDTAYLALPCPPVSFRVHTHKDDNILGGTGLFDRRSNMKQNILLRVAPCGLLLVPLPPPPFNSPSNKTIFLQNDWYEFQDRNDNTSSSNIASSATPN